MCIQCKLTLQVESKYIKIFFLKKRSNQVGELEEIKKKGGKEATY